MGEALITRRGGGAKYRKMEVVFSEYTIAEQQNNVTIDVGFKPVFLYMRHNDYASAQVTAVEKFSVSFTPEWEMESSALGNSYYLNEYWWTGKNSSSGTTHYADAILPTDTGILFNFQNNLAYSPRFEGSYTVWAYG